jgi:general secretion pathway protein J
VTRVAPLSRSEGGFTLLELLVGLVLLALLTAGLTPSLRLGSHAWDAVGREASEAAEVQTAQDFLRRAIAEAYPASFVDEDGHRRLAYAGEADSLAMVTPMPAYLGLGGLQVVRIGVDRREGRRNLVAIWTPLLPDAQDIALGEGAQRTVLAEGIAALDLRYFGRESATEPPAWSETWEGHAGLPKLVRLRVTFPPGSQPSWPDLIARPMVDLGAMVRR